MPKVLSLEDIKLIHNALVREFAETNDPISPPGVRDIGLLESAVNRQFIGSGNDYKYYDEYLSAATLTYGLCMNHCFHNGNKRTALVSMLAHLDKNGLRLENVPQDTLFELFVKLAAHEIHKVEEVSKWAVTDFDRHYAYRKSLELPKKMSSYLKNSPKLESNDVEVYCLAAWLKRKTLRVANYDREVSLRELRRILEKFGIEMERGNDVSYHIIKKKVSYKREGWLFGRKIETPERVRVYTLSCGGEKRHISINQIKELRKACELTANHGIDASQFYGDEPAIDYFLASYSKLLRRLGRT